MRPLLFFYLFLFSFGLYAQKRFEDDIFEVDEVISTTYIVKDGQNLTLDVYAPSGDTLDARPVIIFMHGGGFSGGSPRNPGEVQLAEMAAKRGYVAVQISYRLTRKGKSFGCDYPAAEKINTFKEAAEDFLDAVSYLISNKKRFGIDPEKIIVGGSSAGAEAVLNAVYNRRLLFDNEEDYSHFEFKGVFSLAGAILDARYITEENAVPGVFFHGTDDKLVPYGTAPHHFCDSEAPGYLILDGAESIVRKLEQLRSSYMLVSFRGAGHEISGMPVEDLPEVFTFFNDVFLQNQQQQTEIIR